MDIRLIRTDSDYEEALAEIQRLWEAKPGTSDEAKLELLAMLVHNYERSRDPLPPLDPVEAIKFRMEQQGLSRKDLLPIFGTTARVSEILGGKRALTLDMIRKLHYGFAIPLESLIAPTVLPKRKKRSRSRRRDARTPRLAHA
ncbi:MAG TPA: transcriptional regulator [Labilithrix sp.]|nr:transcriptional regulator [Labilithrix sp.]